MTKDHYFPMEVGILNDEGVECLMEKYGREGLGTYLILLIEARKRDNYELPPSAIRSICRQHGIDEEQMHSLLHDFGLFNCITPQEPDRVSSLYMNRVMEKLEEQRQKCSAAGKKNASNAKRSANGQFTISNRQPTIADGTEKKIKENKTKENTTTNVVVDKDAGRSSSHYVYSTNWEDYLQQAFQDEKWVSALSKNSGLGKLFATYQEDVIEAFRQHVVLQGTEAGISSEKDLKKYFANYLRPGTATQGRLIESIRFKEKKREESSPYRFETVDPQTGERSYFGNLIPQDAPPRPGNNAIWSNELTKWL